ncbi:MULTISPECIES: SRPBCC family protein [Pseudonocardia]|uniref:Polyketide cyclase / dehydrase and lipid transport n=2 Tax=Pseudonocardia TaxID=1847 RepID=A0A1Y2MMP4_PSEAH|nr:MULTISPECIES: SRPBCC family protein [Pseudonocardia]OSY36381.1 Polyketide cyclase / dehydrase and lipid transport [Pseudonocardia autotrophica]TDN72663.1 polyketide cyclase/dehydrase/lipid transport protein [Pseudonocardia autotrophica]BBG03375.1 polyketide cyclase [Pseudonocardia autotrophica]GEC27270.1 polyketide cyclase [Pseudonocardia saturnea]
MPRPYSSAVIPVPLAEVWPHVRDFGGIHRWHPAIDSCELTRGASGAEIGAQRRLVLGDGGVVVEELLALDERGHAVTYEILESPFPVRRYVSTLRLAPVTAAGHTFGEWWTEFDADAAAEGELVELFANGVFATGLEALAQRYA